MTFWDSKSVLVTGATGFIGSWLTEELVKLGAKITVLLNDDSFGNHAVKHLSDDIQFVKGGVEDCAAIKTAAKDKDVIFHLAAITQVLYSIKNPLKTFSVNLGGTLNVLEAVRKSQNNPFLVYVSTDKVYGEPEYLPIDEKHSLSAKSPYDASKVAADRAVYAYHKAYGIRSSILRWSNAYGGRDANILRAVPDFVTSVLDGKPPVIRGNGRHIRDYMYISDIIRALICAAEKQSVSNGEVFNFGTKKPTSVLELAEKIVNLSGNCNIEPKILGRDTPGEINQQYLSYVKAAKLLGWSPKVDLDAGLKETISWYKSNPWWRDVMVAVNKEFGV
ncbi:MAG: GDP-mannose 4,6-dehydratase [Candidatus Aenigmatarchaeota archaeon]